MDFGEPGAGGVRLVRAGFTAPVRPLVGGGRCLMHGRRGASTVEPETVRGERMDRVRSQMEVARNHHIERVGGVRF